MSASGSSFPSPSPSSSGPPPDSRHASADAADASANRDEAAPVQHGGNPEPLRRISAQSAAWRLPLLAACAALAAGGWLGFQSRRHAGPASQAGTEEASALPNADGLRVSVAAAVVPDTESLLARAAQRLRQEIRVPVLADNPSTEEIRRALEQGTAPLSEIRGLAERWARLDPAGFWDWFKDRGIEFDKFSASSVIFQKWIRRDPEAAIRAAGAVSDFRKRTDAMAGILLALPDMDAAVKEKLGARLGLLARLGASFGSLSEEADSGRITQVVTALMDFPAGASRDQVLVNTAAAWFDTDWQASVHWSESVPEPLRSRIKAQVAAKALFAPGKPESFAWGEKWLLTEASPAERQQAGPLWVRAMAKKDPEKALAWTQENLAGRALGEGMRQAIAAQQAKDPAAARALVENLPPGGLREQVAAAAMGQPSVENARWLSGMLTPERQEWEQIGMNWARADADGLRQFLRDEAMDPSKSRLLTSGIIAMMDRGDPQNILDWTLTLPAASTTMALDYWSSTNPKAATGWLTAHAATTTFEPKALEKVSAALMSQSPQAAVDWAADFPAGSNREGVVTAVREQLGKASGLSGEQAAALKERLPSSGETGRD